MEQVESFWLDLEHGASEWQTSKVEQTKYKHTSSVEENIIISSSNNELKEARKKKLQSWVKNKVFIQVPDKCQPKIFTRWICTNKSSNDQKLVKLDLLQETVRKEMLAT